MVLKVDWTGLYWTGSSIQNNPVVATFKKYKTGKRDATLIFVRNSERNHLMTSSGGREFLKISRKSQI